MDVFDKTLQTTNIWLDEIMKEIGPKSAPCMARAGVSRIATTPAFIAGSFGIQSGKMERNHADQSGHEQ